MVFENLTSACAIATTPAALQALLPYCLATQTCLWLPDRLTAAAPSPAPQLIHRYSGPLKATLKDLWPHHDALIFSLATGAVVRLIAPLLGSKYQDPAVVVVDSAGQFVISLCGGHQGGADRLAQQVALQLGATPVLTGAANHQNLPAIDLLGNSFGWRRGSGDWNGVAAAIATQQPVQVIQEAGSPLWQQHLPPEHPFRFGWPDPTATPRDNSPQPQARVWISPIQRRFAPDSNLPKVQWHPRVLWIGVGCERGSSRALIEFAIEQHCRQQHLAMDAIAGIATLDLKADEPGLLALCQAQGWPLRCFPPERLKHLPVPNPSQVVEQAVGTPSVAEAAALAAAQAPEQVSLIAPKQIYRRDPEPGAVTVAIAQSSVEYTGRTGILQLIGTGPGSLEQMTTAAKAAINQADVVIGYGLYIDLIRPLFRCGQIIEALPITQERQRAERAIELANWGLTVAVVSSGDCGIYGMAGLVMEMLAQQGWDGEVPKVEVIPGISALQAAAARVGAPLMHDFCAISLSDLLTPWQVIQQRLEAAAQADFVVALYNPKSKTRTEQIRIAQQIMLAHRPAATPVALVRSVYRQDESITLTTLEEFLQHPVDMLTTVLIGNRSTQFYQGTLITPRGYLGEGRHESPVKPVQGSSVEAI